MEEEGPVSLFIVVYSFTHRQVCIVQLTSPKLHLEGRSMDDAKVVRFIPPHPRIIMRWHVTPTTSFTNDLYILPSCGEPPLHSYQFNFTNGFFKRIKTPLAHKSDRFVVNLGRFTYLMSINDFECYDPDQNLWKALKPFPNNTSGSRFVAYAVCAVCGDDIILFNVDYSAIWAYNVIIDDWYRVLVDGTACYSIVGKAVYVEGTIYALPRDFPFNTVLAMSCSKIEPEASNGDLIYKCRLLSEISVLGMHPIFDGHKMVWTPTRELLHLGKLNFCLVQTCTLRGSRKNLYIQLTYMELTGEKLIIVLQRYHMMEIKDKEGFEVLQCFFLPECKATAFEGGKIFDLEIDPHGVHSVIVRNLPRYATVEQVEKALDVFGPIVRDGILFQNNKKKKFFAFVEFESAASKQRAIEAKTVSIGDCEAEIYDREGNMEKKQPQSSGLQKDGQTQ